MEQLPKNWLSLASGYVVTGFVATLLWAVDFNVPGLLDEIQFKVIPTAFISGIFWPIQLIELVGQVGISSIVELSVPLIIGLLVAYGVESIVEK